MAQRTRFSSFFTTVKFYIVLLNLDWISTYRQTHRLTPFEECTRGQRINSTEMLSNKKLSQLNCAAFCSRSVECLSFNYCQSKFCQLHSKDAFSTDVQFIEDPKCKYFAIKSTDFPKCGDVKGEDTFDEDNDLCGINLKREDAKWAEWHHVIVTNTETEWKKIRFRDCMPSTSTGRQTCDGAANEILGWFKFVSENATWEAAKNNCTKMGGELLHRLNGTKSQLDFFYEKLFNAIFWVGVTLGTEVRVQIINIMLTMFK